jgi:hypothetical protein
MYAWGEGFSKLTLSPSYCDYEENTPRECELLLGGLQFPAWLSRHDYPVGSNRNVRGQMY